MNGELCMRSREIVRKKERKKFMRNLCCDECSISLSLSTTTSSSSVLAAITAGLISYWNKHVVLILLYFYVTYSTSFVDKSICFVAARNNRRTLCWKLSLHYKLTCIDLMGFWWIATHCEWRLELMLSFSYTFNWLLHVVPSHEYQVSLSLHSNNNCLFTFSDDWMRTWTPGPLVRGKA